jgi:hypothetical protein
MAETHAQYMARRKAELSGVSKTSGINAVQPTATAQLLQPAGNPQPQTVTYAPAKKTTTPITNPINKLTSTSGGSGSASASATPAVDPAVLAQYDQSINQTNLGLGNLDSQYNSGLTTINADTTNALNTLLSGYNQSEATYKGNVTDNQKGYIGAKNSIGVNAGNALNGIQRLLGSRGVRGTDTEQVAPGAVARVATQQRNDTDQGFSKNAQTLDTNWGNYKTGYDNSVLSVNDQAERNKRDLKAKIDTTRTSLLQTLANATQQRTLAAGGDPNAAMASAQPFIDQANTLNAGMSNYTTPAINYNTQAYTPPSLSSYTAPPTNLTAGGSKTPNDYVSPYLSALLGEDPNKNKALK